MKSNIESERTLQEHQNKNRSRRILYETVFILVITFAAQFLWKDFQILFAIVPTMYFFIELYLRKRTWVEVGFNIRTVPRDIATNWFLILLVAVIIQFIGVWIAKTWVPAFIDHVTARLPLTIGQPMKFLPVLLIGTLWEEINFRALYQERINWFFSRFLAIGSVSIIFGIGHWANGDPVIVMVDVLLVIADSILYGLIYARSKNIFVAWMAHFLADLFGISFVLVL